MPPRAVISEPYPGPRPFNRSEREIFFGRDEEISDLADLCMSYQVVVLYSQSGAGKSSLVRAGLRPELVRQRVRILPAVRVGGTSHLQAAELQAAGTNNNIYITNTLAALFGNKADQTKSLAQHLSSDHFKGSGSRRPRHAILFDQFEELFTAYLDRWKEREGFFFQVKEALKADPELRAIFVIREERLADLDTYCELVPTNFRIRYRLERLKEDAALLAIQRPPQKFGWTIADEDAKKLIANLRRIKVKAGTSVKEAEGEYVEPVHLQVVCQDIWQKRDGGSSDKVLHVPDAVQDIDRALSSYYDAALQRAVNEGNVREARIRNWLERELITPRGTRGFVYRGSKTTEGLPNTALDILEREHIVRSEPRAGDSWYELTHDRFIAPITHSNSSWRKRHRIQMVPAYLLALLLTVQGVSYLAPKFRTYRSEQIKIKEGRLADDSRRNADAEGVKASDEALKGNLDASRVIFLKAIADYQTAELDDQLSRGPISEGFYARTYAHIGHAFMQIGYSEESRYAYQLAIASAQGALDQNNPLAASLTNGNTIRNKSLTTHKLAASRAITIDALDELARDHLELARVLFRSGSTLFNSGSTGDAIDEATLALHISTDQSDEQGIEKAQSFLGEAYLRRGEFDRAIAAYRSAAQNVTSTERTAESFNDTMALGMVKSQSGRYKEGLYYYSFLWALQAHPLSKPGSPAFLELGLPSRLLREMAFDELHLGDYNLALEHLTIAQAQAKAAHDIEEQAYISLALAEYYLEVKRTPKRFSRGGSKSFVNLEEVDTVRDYLEEELHYSRGAAADARGQFELVNEPVMAGAADTYLARVDIESGEIDKRRGLSIQADSEFLRARHELQEGFNVQSNAERKIGMAYALQAFGILADAQGRSDAAANDYTKSYCLYYEIKVDEQHRHYLEVKDRLRSMNIKTATICDTLPTGPARWAPM
jgi:tetratricopeptide (TPR) repeat protein